MLLASYVEIHIFMIVLLSLILFQANKSKYGGDRYGLRLFNSFVIASMAMIAVRLITWIVNGSSFAHAMELHYLVAIAELLFDPVVYLSWLVYTDYKIYGDQKRLRRVIPIYVVPLFIDVLIILTNIGSGRLFSIDDLNIYHRGSYMVITYSICYLYAILALVLAIAKWRKSETREEKSLCYTHMMFAAPTAIGGLIQLLVYGTNAAWTGLTISIMLCYINDQLLRLEKVNRLETELTQSQISIMLSQIRPHFLYNSLVAIRDLCYTDGEQAAEAVGEFSNYLRGNLDSLSIKTLIPFEKELQHVGNYLSLEKKRFEERLNVEFNLGVREFMLPALTLQPMVENAVRHGITKRETGGTVWISTRETDQSILITVEDDGVGFGAADRAEGDRSHIGMENVRARLLAMCGGTLSITSEMGKGTTVVITIPKGKEGKR